MAIIKISKADKLKGMPSVPGWHKANVVKAEIKPSKDAKSTNLVVTYQIESTEKENEKYFSLKAPGMMVPFLTAINGGKVSSEEEELDTDMLPGKKFQVQIKTGAYNGNLKDEEEGWLPYDAPTEGNGY